MSLRIGEAAQMLGITPKTLRHYEKLGLVIPTRSENGYRLYGPDQILRLLRIRRLQSLGLSLRQVKMILKENTDERLFETILQSLLNDVEGQIESLQERRDQLETLLTNGISSLFVQPVELPAPLQQAQEYLDRHLPETQASLWYQEKQIYALMDHWSYQPPSAFRSALEVLARYYPESVPASVHQPIAATSWSGLMPTHHPNIN